MAILRILAYPDPRLKTIAKPVTDFGDPDIQKMIDDMLETLRHTDHCGGLAATQLDIENPRRIFVFNDYVDCGGVDNQPVAVINPEIIHTEGSVLELEGCMSVCPQHIDARVERPKITHMRAFDRHGHEIEYIRHGYLAKNFMHEVDHLNGKLYIDYLKPLKRAMVDRKINKIKSR